MPAYCSPEDQADHLHDLRKHEPRPTDPTNAIDVAVLVKAVSLNTGAALIEQYARTVAAGARLESVSQAYDLVDGVLTRAQR